MDRLLKALFQVQEFKLRADDDFVDRLNRQYTPIMFVMFTILVSIRQYVGEPITCWVPAQFTASHQDYTNTVCWVSDTYYVPFDRSLPLVQEPRQMISYYQWVPIILLSQATMFFSPCIIWRFLNKRSGINLAAIIEAAMACQRAIYTETREKTVRYMVSQIDGYLIASRSHKKNCWVRFKQLIARYCCIFSTKFSGNYLTCTYLVIKLVYIFNTVGQLFVLDIFLGMRNDYHLYGIFVISRLVRGEDWTSSERFPRVTMCDFRIRQQTNVHNYTVQCVLPINLFNEKIFIFIWFWLFFLSMTTVASFVHWTSKHLVLSVQLSYIKRQLKAVDFYRREGKTARKFLETYLRRDGLFIVRLVGKNAGDMVAADLLHGLWTNYGPERHMMDHNHIDLEARGHQAVSNYIMTIAFINGLVQDCSKLSVLAMELLSLALNHRHVLNRKSSS